MKKKRKEQTTEKKRKEVTWFIRKYIDNEGNLDHFIGGLSPFNLTTVLKQCLYRGMEFDWEE